MHSSSLAFSDLLKKSKEWEFLSKKLNSNEFLDFCKENLKIKENFTLSNFFFIENPSNSEVIYKKLSNEKIKSISSIKLIKYLLFRILRDFTRKIKYSKLFNLRKIPVELLYNYSIAGDGYFREIHRDSDNKVIVFLLYLSEMPNSAEGGSLDIYKLKDKKNNNLAQPKNEMCDKLASVKPKPGRLVIFKNTNDSFHAVNKLKNSNNERHFIYGGFTSLGQKNPFITNRSKLRTEFSIYD